MKRALFIGRCQPFHMGHLHAIRFLLKRFDELVVVMGSSLDSYSPENPFTSGERIEMLRLAFTKSELARLIIIPVPDINDNSSWVSHTLLHVPHVDEVYSNNEMVKHLFAMEGIKTQTIKFLDREMKQGRRIRSMIAKGNSEWKKHVPQKVAKYLISIDTPRRMREIIRRP